MIIENGTIELKQKTSGGGVDPTTGYPHKPASVGWATRYRVSIWLTSTPTSDG